MIEKMWGSEPYFGLDCASTATCHVMLIVVGTREPNLPQRLLGQSVREPVQRQAHCDVRIDH